MDILKNGKWVSRVIIIYHQILVLRTDLGSMWLLSKNIKLYCQWIDYILTVTKDRRPHFSNKYCSHLATDVQSMPSLYWIALNVKHQMVAKQTHGYRDDWNLVAKIGPYYPCIDFFAKLPKCALPNPHLASKNGKSNHFSVALDLLHLQ